MNRLSFSALPFPLSPLLKCMPYTRSLDQLYLRYNIRDFFRDERLIFIVVTLKTKLLPHLYVFLSFWVYTILEERVSTLVGAFGLDLRHFYSILVLLCSPSHFPFVSLPPRRRVLPYLTNRHSRVVKALLSFAQKSLQK